MQQTSKKACNRNVNEKELKATSSRYTISQTVSKNPPKRDLAKKESGTKFSFSHFHDKF